MNDIDIDSPDFQTVVEPPSTLPPLHAPISAPWILDVERCWDSVTPIMTAVEFCVPGASPDRLWRILFVGCLAIGAACSFAVLTA